jgi:hypothetical protein
MRRPKKLCYQSLRIKWRELWPKLLPAKNETKG